MFCHVEAIKCEWAPFTAPLYLISGPRYSQKSHIFFCWKVAERNFRNPLFAKFDFYVLSSGGHKMWVSAVYRTTLSHKRTEIFTKIAYFLLLESSRTKFKKPFVSKVWFLWSVIWRLQKGSERRLPHHSHFMASTWQNIEINLCSQRVSEISFCYSLAEENIRYLWISWSTYEID